MPAISVIVPIFNVERYIEKCLISLDMQTFADIEFILVNDGSQDGSVQICEDFIKDKKKFIIYHKKNGGLVSAWMEGLRHASAEYVGFVDSDDYIEPNMYEVLYHNVLIHNVDVSMCGHIYDNIDGTCSLCPSPIPEGYYAQNDLISVYKNMWPQIGCAYISPARWNKLIRKELLLKNIKFCDERISSGEDVNIILPIELSMKSFYFSKQPLYHYCQRETSISYTYKPELFDTYILLLDKLEEAINHYKKNNLMDEFYHTILIYPYMFSRRVLALSIDKSVKRDELNRILLERKYFEAAKQLRGHCRSMDEFLFALAIRIKSIDLMIAHEYVFRKLRTVKRKLKRQR